MKVGVVAALQTELKLTLGAIPTTPRQAGHLRFHESPSLIFVAGGVGARPAAAATLVMVDTFKPDAILSIGFCGALTDDLETAELLLGGTTEHAADPALLSLARSAAPKARVADVFTVPQVVVAKDEKRELARKSGAMIVDMEANAVAVAAKARGLPFLAVKTVIDTPSSPLASTYSGCWTVLKDLLRGSLMGMIYDSKRVKIASERLRDFFVALKAQLPPTK
jgi:nucleoside phosphorylase